MAYDQDTGINARLRYSIILGNEGGFFEMNAQTGELFLIREIDLEKLTNPTLSLQIQASQVDNPFRQALARVDISVQDINDNSPEVSFEKSSRAKQSQVFKFSSPRCFVSADIIRESLMRLWRIMKARRLSKPARSGAPVAQA